MALIKVYEWDFYSNLGSRYKIELHQEGGTPITSGLALSSDGFIMSSKADEDNRFSPVIGTEVEIPILIEDPAAELFITNIVINQEKNSFIKIFVWNGSSYDIFFRGIVFQDMAVNEDAYYPYEMKLYATDGFSRLKNIDFNNNGNPYTGKITYKNAIALCLNNLGLNNLYTLSDPFICSGIDYIENNAQSGDMLDNMRINHEAFYTVTDGDTTFMNCYDVLSHILISLGARISQYKGSFHILTVTRYTNIVNTTFYRYNKLPASMTSSSEKVILEQIKWGKSASSVYNTYPAVKRVITSYNFRHSQYGNSTFIPDVQPYDYAQLAYIEGGLGQKLGFYSQLTVNYTYNAGLGSPASFKVRMKITLNVGNYWLTGLNFNRQWTYSLTPLYYYWDSNSVAEAFTNTMTCLTIFQTPPIPDEGYLSFGYEVHGLYNFANTAYTLIPDASIEYIYPASLGYVASYNLLGTGTKVVTAENIIDGSIVDTANIYETEEVILGDVVYNHDVGKIEIYNGGSWVNSYSWTYRGDTDDLGLEQLRANDLLSIQRTPRIMFDINAYLKINTNFSDRCNPIFLALYNNSIIYVPIAIQFNAGFDDISGVYFEINRITQNITNTEAIQEHDRFSGSDQNDVNTRNTSSILSVSGLNSLTNITSSISGTIASIPVTNIGDAIISKGDVLTIYDPLTGLYEDVTVSANYESGNTSISINSTTLTNDYQLNSLVLYKQKRTIRKAANPRLTTQTLTTDGSIGVFDVTILNGAGSTVAASLPRAADAKNKTFTIKCISSTFACSIASVDSIEGQSSIGLRKGEVLKVYSNGITWQIVAAIQRTQSVKFISDASYDEDIDPAEMRWNSEDGTVEIGMGYDDVVQQVGLEIYYRVKNQTGDRIRNGTVVIYDGSVGASGIIKAKPADSTLANFPSAILGVATMDINNGEDGFVTHFGLVRQINTSAFVDGDVLYWNPAVTGGLTATRPTAPDPAIIVAAVVVAAANGTILVRPDAGKYLHDLHDVAMYNPDTLDNDSAQLWDSSDKVWKTQVLNTSNWDSAYNKILSSASFSTTTGVITLTLADSSTVTVDIDGRFIQLSEKGAANGVATLDSSGKLPTSQLPTSVLTYLGTWDASTNSPTLADGTGTAGNFYIVSVAGTQDLGSGNITFAAGDWVVYNGSIWEKSSNSSAVASVNGFTGAVVLTTTDIAEGTNYYYTEARVSANTDVAANTAARHTHSNKTTLDGITGTKVSNWDTAYGWGNHAGLYDALGAGSVAVGTHESTYNHANFATAYSWGNHAAVGYLTAETDPIYTASSWYTTTNNSTNWDAAYSWGNWATGVNKTFIDALNVDADTLDGNDSSYFYPASNPNSYTTNLGTVTSVGLSMPTGFSVTNSPVTTSNTLTVTFSSGYKLLTTTAESNYNAAYNEKINTITFNASNGVITFTRQNGTTSSVDIDGRFELVGVAAAAISTHESTYNHTNFATAYSWGNWATGVNKTFIDALNVDADTLDGYDSSYFYPASNPSGFTSNTGTVTSVAISVPIGLVVTSGNPITTNGTIAIDLQTGYTIPATALQSVWSTAYNNMITAASFSTSTGVLTLTQQDLGTITVDLDGRYLESYTETDPIYTASTWYTTTNNATNWDTAYGWGNHSGLYDLSGTASTAVSTHESTYNHSNYNTAYSWGDHAGLYDLLGSASSAVSGHESTYNHSNYNTAYSWGDHALAGYLTAETDPVFTASDAYSITSTQISNWDTAYGWGDHAGLYDLSGAASTAVGTHESTYNHSNYNTAYSWGNHASAGYMVATSYPDLTAIEALTGTGLLRRTGVNTWALDGSANLGIHTFILDVSRSESASVSTSDFYTLHMPYDFKITSVMASVTERPLGQAILIDITDNATSIFNTVLSIDDGDYSSYSSANPYDLASDTITADHQVIIDVTQVGTTQRGAGLKVYICGYKA